LWALSIIYPTKIQITNEVQSSRFKVQITKSKCQINDKILISKLLNPPPLYPPPLKLRRIAPLPPREGSNLFFLTFIPMSIGRISLSPVGERDVYVK
jgi:hypothetical protein